MSTVEQKSTKSAEPVKSAALDLSHSTVPSVRPTPSPSAGAGNELAAKPFGGANFSFDRAQSLKELNQGVHKHPAPTTRVQPQNPSLLATALKQIVALFRDGGPRTMIEALLDWVSEALGKLHNLLLGGGKQEEEHVAPAVQPVKRAIAESLEEGQNPSEQGLEAATPVFDSGDDSGNKDDDEGESPPAEPAGESVIEAENVAESAIDSSSKPE